MPAKKREAGLWPQIWQGVTGSLQVKFILLITSVILLLLAAFVWYDIQAQRATLEEMLLQKSKTVAIGGAAAVAHIFEDAINSGRLTEAAVFDTNYQPIPNTNPQKYHTLYDSFTDANLQVIYDSYLVDTDLQATVAQDINGYMPTHITRYSKPLTGDYATDLIGNRAKRRFDDPVALAAGQNMAPFLHQIYYRDIGELVWDVSAPIRVNGKHWGAFRVGISLATIDAKITALIWRISLAAGLLVIAIGLAVFLVARQISKPIQTLAAATEKISQGDFDIQTKIKTGDELERLGEGFNLMARHIKKLIDTLEQQVSDRTRRLELLAVLSERFNSILNQEELLAEVVNQIKDKFGYYHAHIYSLDAAGERLVVTQGTGPAGAEMKAAGHSIPLNAPTSLVASAARTGKVVKVDEVRRSLNWLPNPLLPDTQAEMAVPIILEGQLFGVLDVQSDKVAGLDEGDANLLRSLSSQVAVALRNARLFTQVETALAEARLAQAQYIQQTWRTIGSHQPEYNYQKFGARPLAATTQTHLYQAASRQSEPIIVNSADSTETEAYTAILAPIKLQDQVIGTLQIYNTAPVQSQLWDERDIALVQAVIDQVAQTAESLRLFEETRQRAGREQTIREITDKLRAAPDLDTLLETAARELGQRLGVRHTIMELGVETAEAPVQLAHPEAGR